MAGGCRWCRRQSGSAVGDEGTTTGRGTAVRLFEGSILGRDRELTLENVCARATGYIQPLHTPLRHTYTARRCFAVWAVLWADYVCLLDEPRDDAEGVHQLVRTSRNTLSQEDELIQQDTKRLAGARIRSDC